MKQLKHEAITLVLQSEHGRMDQHFKTLFTKTKIDLPYLDSQNSLHRL